VCSSDLIYLNVANNVSVRFVSSGGSDNSHTEGISLPWIWGKVNFCRIPAGSYAPDDLIPIIVTIEVNIDFRLFCHVFLSSFLLKDFQARWFRVYLQATVSSVLHPRVSQQSQRDILRIVDNNQLP